MNQFFVEAFDIQSHPMKRAKKKIQTEYVTALTYVIENTISEISCQEAEIKKYVITRLHLYQSQLFANTVVVNTKRKKGINCLSVFAKPWRRKYCFMLVCDIALILLEERLILRAVEMFKECLSFKRQADIEQIISLLQNSQDVEKKYSGSFLLLGQYRVNRDFYLKKERRIIVTANMSAGKSTLINALIGKPIARTSQEVCTGNICYLFNKAYEDGNIHLSTQELNLNATTDDLHNYDWNENISIASYFTGIISDVPRLCIIDTPGVDASSLYKEHGERARQALLTDNYDIIIYVVSPTRLGTDAEKNHLQWVIQNLQKEKIVFVLNKIDEYHDFSENIGESIHNFKEDLRKIGFENPVICPISAYFSYLLKLRMTGQTLSEDEMDEYALYSKRFKRSSYDLSHYYEDVQCSPIDSEKIALSKRAGLYGLEKILYGGRL